MMAWALRDACSWSSWVSAIASAPAKASNTVITARVFSSVLIIFLFFLRSLRDRLFGQDFGPKNPLARLRPGVLPSKATGTPLLAPLGVGYRSLAPRYSSLLNGASERKPHPAL